MSESILEKMRREYEAEESFKKQTKDKELVILWLNEEGNFVDEDGHPCSIKPIGEPFIIRSYNEAIDELKKYWNSYTKNIEFPESSRRIGIATGTCEFLNYGSSEMFCAAQLYLILQD